MDLPKCVYLEQDLEVILRIICVIPFFGTKLRYAREHLARRTLKMSCTLNSARYRVELLEDQAIQCNEPYQATEPRMFRYERLE
jgi:hypothetical protein